jgi:hypothetical protein
MRGGLDFKLQSFRAVMGCLNNTPLRPERGCMRGCGIWDVSLVNTIKKGHQTEVFVTAIILKLITAITKAKGRKCENLSFRA